MREYKKQIDDLKQSLSQLDKASADYSRTAQLLSTLQKSYNDTMSAFSKSGQQTTQTMLQITQQTTQLKDKMSELVDKLKGVDESSEAFLLVQQEIQTTAALLDLLSQESDKLTNLPGIAGEAAKSFSAFGIKMTDVSGKFSLATTAASAFSKILTVLKAHPIMAALTVLATIFMKVASHIQKNKQATEALRKAMAVFQPIVNIVNKVLDKLAIALAEAAEWLADKVPGAIKFLGKGLATGIRAFGGLVQAVAKFASVSPQMFLKAVSLILTGIQKVADGIGDLADAVGLDWGKSLHGITNNIKSFVDGASDAILKFTNGISGFFDGMASKVEGFANNLSTQMVKSKKIAEETINYEHDLRANAEADAASSAKQAHLREQIAQTDGKKKLELLKELKDETDKQGRAQVELAERALKLAKAQEALGVKGAKALVHQAQINLDNVKASAESANATVEKQYHRMENSLASHNTALSKAQTKQQKKEQEAADKAAREASQKLVAEYQNQRKLRQDQYKTDLEMLDKNLEARIRAEAKNDADVARITREEYDKRIALQNKFYAEELAAQDKMLANTQLLEDARARIILDKSSTANDLLIQNLANISEIAKLKTKEIVASFNAQLKEARSSDSAADTQNIMKKLGFELTPEEAADIINKLEGVSQQERDILIKQYADMYNDKVSSDAALETQEHDHQQKLIEIQRQKVEALKEMDGVDAKTLFEEQLALNQMEEEETQRHNDVLIQINKDSLAKEQKTIEAKRKAWFQLANSMGAIFGTMANILKEDIQNKVENGEITEEQAKKSFEDVKKLQIAEAIISTLSGALQSQMSIWSDPSLKAVPLPLKIALSVATGLSQLAAGFAQVQQIKNTQYGSSSTSGATQQATSVAFSPVAVSPILDEQADLSAMPQETFNSGSQRVYILESDIQDSNNRVQVRESETSF